eukprot:6476492-Amphidinium_carterae.2
MTLLVFLAGGQDQFRKACPMKKIFALQYSLALCCAIGLSAEAAEVDVGGRTWIHLCQLGGGQCN